MLGTPFQIRVRRPDCCFLRGVSPSTPRRALSRPLPRTSRLGPRRPEACRSSAGEPPDFLTIPRSPTTHSHPAVHPSQRKLTPAPLNSPWYPPSHPRARSSLASSFLFKFFLRAALALEKDLPGFSAQVAPTELSAAAAYHRPPSRGLQYYTKADGDEAVGAPLMHCSAELQVTGEAVYTDDMPRPAGSLHAALIMSDRPHAKLLSIDTAAALARPSPPQLTRLCASLLTCGARPVCCCVLTPVPFAPAGCARRRRRLHGGAHPRPQPHRPGPAR